MAKLTSNEFGELAERCRHMYENWSLGAKGPFILTEVADAIVTQEAEIADLRKALDVIAEYPVTTPRKLAMMSIKRIARAALQDGQAE